VEALLGAKPKETLATKQRQLLEKSDGRVGKEIEY